MSFISCISMWVRRSPCHNLSHIRVQWVSIFFLFVLLTGCSLFHGDASQRSRPAVQNQAKTVVASAATIDQVSAQVLDNMHQHAWNPQARTRNVVTGGLFINWKMDNPSLTNAVRAGADGNPQHNHDPQVDLLYLISLAEYQQLHPNEHTYASDISHTTALVLADFQSYNLPKGWPYFYLLRAGTMLHQTQLIDEAHKVASNVYTYWYDPRLGTVYNRNHTQGDYSVDHTFQSGAALIDAGMRWHVSDWVSAGQKTLAHLLDVTLDPTYHQFYNSMLVSSTGHDTVQNYQAKPSTQGEAVQALLLAYQLTHDQRYLAVSRQVLAALFGSTHLWDMAHGGFYFALDMQKGRLLKDYKETRSQTLVLIAVHSYNRLVLAQQLVAQEQELIRTLTDHFYQHTYKGFFYRVASDFRVYVSRPGNGIGVEDYFTTEAMGSALDALQQTEM